MNIPSLGPNPACRQFFVDHFLRNRGGIFSQRANWPYLISEFDRSG